MRSCLRKNGQWTIPQLHKVCRIGEWSISYMHSKVEKNFSCSGKNLMKHQILLISWQAVKDFVFVLIYLDCSVQRCTCKLIIIFGIDHNLHNIMSMTFKNLLKLPIFIPIPKFDQHVICAKYIKTHISCIHTGE